MSDKTQEKRTKIPLKAFLADYLSGIPDREIMRKYELDAKGFVTLLQGLVDKNMLTAEDISRRKELAHQQKLAQENQFLKSLYLCSQCEHPHPHRFDVCPACGAVQEQDDQLSAQQDALEEHFGMAIELSATGEHFYVSSKNEEIVEEQTPAPAPETEDSPKEKRSPFKSLRNLFSRKR